jgi:hypothetical protein
MEMSTDTRYPGYTEQEWQDARLRGIAADYFPDAQHWPAAMLCMQHLLMEQSKAAPMVPARDAAQSIQPEMMQPGTKARKVGGKFEANGTIVASWVDPDDGKPRYAFRFDFPAGMTHFYTAEQVRERRADDPVGMSPLDGSALLDLAERHVPEACFGPHTLMRDAVLELAVGLVRAVELAHDIR